MNICNIRKMKNINFSTPMKLKSKLLLTAFIVVLLLGLRVSTQAQGIFSTDSDEKKADNTENTQTGDNNIEGGLFRGIGDGPDDGKPSEPGNDDDPIGEGILLLSILSGAYALVRRNLKRKYEN